MDRWRPPASDRALGLEFYVSNAPGVAARIKSSPEEFRVHEVSSYPLPDANGEFTVLRVESRDWEQHELAEAIARRLGLGRHALQWAGTKDRRAVSERLFSYRGPPPTGDVGLRDVRLLEAYRARDGLVLGHLYGNVFDLTLADLAGSPGEVAPVLAGIATELRAAGGFPNFFGAQRFGEVRPITHEVGRWVVRGDLGRAIDVYLSDRPATGTAGVGDAARASYAAHHDAARALREFPREYRFERALLERLARGDSSDRAFRSLSRDLRTLFVHAFQSLVFNRWVSARHAAGLPPATPVPGDRILRIARDGTVRGPDAVPVAADNLPECRELVTKGRALLAGPLVGFDTPEGAEPPVALLDRILADEAVERSMFRVPAAPEVASSGAWRPVVVPMPPVTFVPEADRVRCRFALPKGAYATVLLREFLKTGATPVSEDVPSSRAF